MEESIFQIIKNLEAESKAFGFYWKNTNSLLTQISSELEEIHEILDPTHKNHKMLQEEIGDLLLAAISLCIFLDKDPEETFLIAIDKYKKRFTNVKSLVLESGLKNLKYTSEQKCLEFWKKAKKV